MMAEEKTVTAASDQKESGEGTPKEPKSFARRAAGNLRQARRAVQTDDWPPEERVRHLVAEANVLALLDLADAIRSTGGAAAGSTSDD